jgi:hypothetical protein
MAAHIGACTGIDVGGTFTDVVVHAAGHRPRAVKVHARAAPQGVTGQITVSGLPMPATPTSPTSCESPLRLTPAVGPAWWPTRGSASQRLRRVDGTEEELPSKCTWQLRCGDRVRIKTPGGGVGAARHSKRPRTIHSHAA